MVYHFRCPGCHNDYIGKTERILWERINEHGYRNKNNVIYNHIYNKNAERDIIRVQNSDIIRVQNVKNLTRNLSV